MKKALLGLAALVAVLVVAGIVAPSLIDWTRYREQVAIEIERALGRRVIIEGKVAATLLPAPRLSLFGARLGNLPGATAADMAQAEALDIRLALGPLLTGKIVVESVVLRRPVIALEILADGRRNWQFAPSGRTDVRFEDAVISDGTITFIDARSGREERVEGVNGRFSADSLSGPLRAAAELRYRSVPLRFNLSTGRFDPSGAATTPFTLKAELPGASRGLGRGSAIRAEASLSGSLRWAGEGPQLAAQMKLEGDNLAETFTTIAGRAASGLLAQPFALDGAVDYRGDTITAKDLALRIGESRAQAAIVATQAEFVTPRVDIDVNFRRVDFDAWVAAAEKLARSAPPSGGDAASPAEPEAFSVPAGLHLALDINADALTYRGGAFRQIKLAAELADGIAEIHQLSAQLPAATDASFNGRLVAANGRPQLVGVADIASDDFRNLASWFGVDISDLPAGRLNKVSALARIAATEERLEVGEIDVRFDATRVTGALIALLRARPAIGANLIVDRIDLDSYSAPVARGAKAAPPKADAIKPLDLLAGFDANLRLRVGQVTTHRVVVRELSLDGKLADDELNLGKLTIGDMAGGKGVLSGTLAGFQGTPRMDVEFDYLSERPDAVLSALGIALAFEDGALTPLSTSGKVSGASGAYAIDATVAAGDTSFAIKGDLGRTAEGVQRTAVDVKLAHPDYVEFLQLFDSDFTPRRATQAVTVDLAARLEGGDDNYSLSSLTGNFGPVAIGGQAAFAFEGALPRVNADLALGDVDTGYFLSPVRGRAAAARWSAEPIDLDFAWIVGGHFAISAKSLRHGRWSIGDPKIDFTVGGGGADLGQLSGRMMGGRLAASGGISPSGKAETTMVLDYSLSLTGADAGPSLFGGTAIDIVGGRFDLTAEGAAVGASEATMLAAMTGKGSVALRNSAIKGFDLARLNEGFPKLNSTNELNQLSQSALAGGTTKINNLRSTFAITDGVVAVDDLRIDSPSGQVRALLAVDLPRWRLDATTELRLAEQPTAPPIDMQLTGALDAPAREIITDGLQDFLRTILAARATRRPVPAKPAPAPAVPSLPLESMTPSTENTPATP